MATIADVAKLAGVSTGTVSRVMNGAENVHPETRAKVQHAIEQLEYEPNFQARSLRNKRTDTIGLAMPELANYFWTTVAQGAQDASQAKGYHVLICNTGGRSSNYLRYLELMVNRVDGMILSRRSERVVAQNGSSSREKPIVFVGQSQAANWNVDNVYSDSISGAFALTQHLIQLGHENIAIVTGRQTSASASDRVTGYTMALADARIAIQTERICWGEYDRKTAERLTDDLIERQPDTTAIFAANNEIAIGVICALEKRQIAVPETVAVVCFDDFYPDSRFATLMTVASQSPYDLGVNAAQLLIYRLNTEATLRPQTVVLPPRLIVRQSSGGTPTPIDRESSINWVQGQLIPSLPRQKIVTLAAEVTPFVQVALPVNDIHLLHANKAQNAAVKRALRRTGSDETLVHFEYAVTSPELYRYVLEREPRYELIGQTSLIVPEDQVEFAQRTGIAAIPCRYPYQPELVDFEVGWGTENELPFDFPPLTDQIDFFDRYVRAARNTNVGIAADFHSLAADTLHVLNTLDAAQDRRQAWMESIAEDLLHHQRKIVQLICDRFAADLAFAIFNDAIADAQGLCIPRTEFDAVFTPRIQQLIHPAKEHNLPTVLYTPGMLESLLPMIAEIGFDAVYVAQAELNDVKALKGSAGNRLSFMGGIPFSTLTNHTSAAEIKDLLVSASAGGGYIAGVSGEINDRVPLANFFTLLGVLSAGSE